MIPIKIKRIYDEAEEIDGRRILVDRLWPRGISKERAALSDWSKELAPSESLRKQYHADNNWEHFCSSYQNELLNQSKKISELKRLVETEQITLLTAVTDTKKNHPIILSDIIMNSLDF